MNTYNELLTKQIWASVFGFVLVLVLAIVLFEFNKRHIFDDLGKIGKTVVNIFIVAVILLTSVHDSVRIFYLYKDIHEQAYITYNGDFEVSPYKDSYVTLKSESGQLILNGRVDLPGGQYSGTIVYAQNSKYVLDWNVD